MFIILLRSYLGWKEISDNFTKMDTLTKNLGKINLFISLKVKF